MLDTSTLITFAILLLGILVPFGCTAFVLRSLIAEVSSVKRRIDAEQRQANQEFQLAFEKIRSLKTEIGDIRAEIGKIKPGDSDQATTEAKAAIARLGRRVDVLEAELARPSSDTTLPSPRALSTPPQHAMKADLLIRGGSYQTGAVSSQRLARELFEDWCAHKSFPKTNGVDFRPLRLVAELSLAGEAGPFGDSERVADFARIGQSGSDEALLFPNPECRFSALLGKVFPDLREGWDDSGGYHDVVPLPIRRGEGGLWRIST